MGHHARIGRQSVAAQLPKRRELGHCFEQMRGSCGSQHCRWHFCSLNRGGRDPLSNRLGVCHGASVPQRNFTPNIQIGSSSYGHLVHMACVTQSPGHHGGKGKGFCRTLTWGLWHLGDVHVVCHMSPSKIESRVAVGKGGAAQLLLGSTPQRCVRSWLVLWGWKSLLCHKVVQTWVGIGSEWSQAFHEADPLGSMSNEGRPVGGPRSEGHRHFCSGPFSG